MTFVTLLVYITYLKTGLFARQHYIKKKTTHPATNKVCV